MTRRLLTELSVVFALESCVEDLDDDEGMRLAAISTELRDRAAALALRAVDPAGD